MYAALGLGLVVVHRASGVVNFAHGAMAMYAAYVFAELRTRGDLVLPVVGLPGRIHLGGPVPVPVSLMISVAAAAALGAFVYTVVYRPLRDAPPLASVVASVGVMIVLQAVVALRFGPASRLLAPVLPAEPVHFAGAVLPRDRLYLAALVVLVAAALAALYRLTPFGIASRAAAEDRNGLATTGWSPDRLACANWVIASALAAVAGVLVSPITALNPLTYTLLVVPALAAALVGRMSSFVSTVAAGLALGMVQSLALKLQDDHAWFPEGGREAIPLIAITIALVLGWGSGSRAAGEQVLRRLPQAGPFRASAASVVPAAAALAGLFLLDSGYRLALITTIVGAVICLSIVLLTGWLGQISLAHMAFAGIAGFALSRLGEGWGIPFPLAPLLAALLASAVGALVAIPALRLHDASLAVVTIAAAVAIEETVFKHPSVSGGFAGVGVPRPSLAGLDLGPHGSPGEFPRPIFGLVALAVLLGAAYGAGRLRNSRPGRRMLAVRSDQRAAASLGVGVTVTKLWGFAVSAFVAGSGGALLAYSQGRLSFGSFGVFVSLSYLAVTYIGGVGRVSGALAGGLLVPGGLLFTALDRAAGLGRYQLLATGGALVAMAVLSPDGLVGRIPNPVRLLRSERDA